MSYKIKYTKQSEKDARLLARANLDGIAMSLIAIITQNPYHTPPSYEKLRGDFKGLYSRRINRQHRLVYDVLPNNEGLTDVHGAVCQGIVKIIRMWTHYE